MTGSGPGGSFDSLSGVSVLVTGGAGLIGRAAVTALLAEGARVTVFDRGGLAPASRVDPAAAFVAGDVTDPLAVRQALAGADAVVHLGGFAGLGLADAAETYRVNAGGTFTVLAEAASAGVRKVVYASSINANGYPLGAAAVLPPVFPYDEDAPPRISDEYSLSKQAGEDAARAVHSRWGMSLTGLRFPLVREIGVDGGRVFGAHLRDALAGDPRRQAAEGWSYLDVADAARAIVLALLRETPPAPGILVAAPLTYLSTPTEQALELFAPEVPRRPLAGRSVGLDLGRSAELLGFAAAVLLDDVAPEQLVDVTAMAHGAGRGVPR
ncbi:NAD(P)-dependent oxidoreductase [Herbiconiux sp. 11R-BC]|uniref:NAD-dependent epimerase/dehydratase family protein n=1 Tax=Herbiconiux sp. 11R-BC TaxID=3111637 RepID=UPI003C0303CB